MSKPVNSSNKVSKYAKASAAKAQAPSNYIRPGHLLAVINRLEEGEAFKKGSFVAANMTVVKVFPDSVEGFNYDRKIPLGLHTIGEAVSDIMMMSNVAFEGRIKAFVMTAGDLGDEDFASEEYPGQIIDEAVGETQPLAGTVLELRARTIVKKDARHKAEAELTNNDVYTRIDYVRAVPAEELPELLDEATLARFFPDLVS